MQSQLRTLPAAFSNRVSAVSSSSTLLRRMTSVTGVNVV